MCWTWPYWNGTMPQPEYMQTQSIPKATQWSLPMLELYGSCNWFPWSQPMWRLVGPTKESIIYHWIWNAYISIQGGILFLSFLRKMKIVQVSAFCAVLVYVQFFQTSGQRLTVRNLGQNGTECNLHKYRLCCNLAFHEMKIQVPIVYDTSLHIYDIHIHEIPRHTRNGLTHEEVMYQGVRMSECTVLKNYMENLHYECASL